MWKLSALAVIVVGLAQSQQVSVVPGDRFAWEMTGPGLEAIKSYRYEIEIDGTRQATTLMDVTCAPTADAFECTAAIPVRFGPHAVRVRSIDASVPGLPAIEGPWSPLWPYVMRPTPPTPAKLRAVKPTKGE